jgi:hypothetical protein
MPISGAPWLLNLNQEGLVRGQPPIGTAPWARHCIDRVAGLWWPRDALIQAASDSSSITSSGRTTPSDNTRAYIPEFAHNGELTSPAFTLLS